MWRTLCTNFERAGLNPLKPNDPYRGRTAPLTSKRCILYIYSTNMGTEYFKHSICSPFFSSSKWSLLHNSNVFGSSIIHILYTGCAKIKKKIIPAPKGWGDKFRTKCYNRLQRDTVSLHAIYPILQAKGMKPETDANNKPIAHLVHQSSLHKTVPEICGFLISKLWIITTLCTFLLCIGPRIILITEE